MIKTQNDDNVYRNRVRKIEEERLKTLNYKFVDKKAKKDNSSYRNETGSPIDTISRNNSNNLKSLQTETNNDNSFSNRYNTNVSSNLHSITLSNEQSPKRSKGIITFEKYSARKDIFKNTKIPILTYLEPIDLLKDNK